MAGYRRGTGRPLAAVLRAERRNRVLTTRLAQATTPQQQVSVACDYLRGVLARIHPGEASRVAGEVVRLVVGAAREAEQADINRRKKELSNHDHSYAA